MSTGVRTLASLLEPPHPLALANPGHSVAPWPKRMARAAVTSVYARQRQVITVKHLDRAPAPRPLSCDPKIECLAVESVLTLDALAAEIPGSFRDSVDDLRRRLAQGCLVFLARRVRDDGTGHEIVGYEISERGVFSALGRRHRVADDIVFSHYAEVIAAHRGRRIHGLLFATRDAYFRERGGRLVAGVCLPQNHASLRALRRDGAMVVGSVESLCLFRRLRVWSTPFERVEAALQPQRSVER
jgi:hypothetical protein